MLAAIWRDVLGLERVGVHDSFFDLGGHSLQVVQVHARLVGRLGRDLPLVDLFTYPTVAALAAHLRPEGSAQPTFAAARERAQRQRQAFSQQRVLVEAR